MKIIVNHKLQSEKCMFVGCVCIDSHKCDTFAHTSFQCTRNVLCMCENLIFFFTAHISI